MLLFSAEARGLVKSMVCGPCCGIVSERCGLADPDAPVPYAHLPTLKTAKRTKEHFASLNEPGQIGLRREVADVFGPS